MIPLSIYTELKALKSDYEKGAITDEEYTEQKSALESIYYEDIVQKDQQNIRRAIVAANNRKSKQSSSANSSFLQIGNVPNNINGNHITTISNGSNSHNNTHTAQLLVPIRLISPNSANVTMLNLNQLKSPEKLSRGTLKRKSFYGMPSSSEIKFQRSLLLSEPMPRSSVAQTVDLDRSSESVREKSQNNDQILVPLSEAIPSCSVAQTVDIVTSSRPGRKGEGLLGERERSVQEMKQMKKTLTENFENAPPEEKLQRLLEAPCVLSEFLVEKKLHVDVNLLNKVKSPCFNPHCPEPNGLYTLKTNRKRKNFSLPTAILHKCGYTFNITKDGFLSNVNLYDCMTSFREELILQVIWCWIGNKSIDEISYHLGGFDISILYWIRRTRLAIAEHVKSLPMMGNKIITYHSGLPDTVFHIHKLILNLNFKNGIISSLDKDSSIVSTTEDEEESMYSNVSSDGINVFCIAKFDLDPYSLQYHTNEVRLFCTNYNVTEEIRPIILSNIASGNHIRSDDWKTIFDLGQNDGMIYKTGYEEKYYAHPLSDLWNNIYADLIKDQGEIEKNIPLSMAEYWWRHQRRFDNIWEQFIDLLNITTELFPIFGSQNPIQQPQPDDLPKD